MASNRITVTGVLTKDISFERPAYAGFGRMETVHIYKITGEDGTVYVWKTATGSLGMEVEAPYETRRNVFYYDDRKHVAILWDGVYRGDTFTFTASVKCVSEYKGEPQTEIQRVKVTAIIDSPTRRREEKKQEQLNSVKGEDFIWEMPYAQYKKHYSDCETVIDSYDDHADEGERYGDYFGNPVPTIQVVIREGRLKVSGVRGKHFSGFEIEFTDADGKIGFAPYRAINEENAIKQAMKDFPKGTNFHCRKIYSYR